MRLILAAVATLLLAGTASAQEKVEFASGDGTKLAALVFKPAGNGPFPAVVAMHGCAVPDAAVSHADLLKAAASDSHVLADGLGHLTDGPLLRFAVIGGRALAAIERKAVTLLESEPEWRQTDATGAAYEAARGLAEQAARALDLGLVAVDVVGTRAGPMVVDVTANLSVAQMERLSGAALIEAVIVHVEQVVRSRRG